MSKIVGISEAASIAIHVMVIIARSDSSNMNVNRLAELTGASKNHIAKVMQRLVKFNYVKSTRGPSGGFVINKNPEEITLLDIYEAIEGEVSVDECPFDNQICPFNKCLMNGIIHKTTNEIKVFFSEQKLSNML
jgi:Rrf2 family protein